MKSFNADFFDYEVVEIKDNNQRVFIDPQGITYTFACIKLADIKYLDDSVKVINDVLKDFFPNLWKESFSFKSFAFAVEEDTLMGMGTPDITMIPSALKKNQVKNSSSIVIIGSNLFFDNSNTKTKVWVGFTFNSAEDKFYMPSIKDSVLPKPASKKNNSIDDLMIAINSGNLNKVNEIVKQNPNTISNKSLEYNEYPIILASFKGNLDVLSILHNTNPKEFNRISDNGKSPALIAISEGKRDAFKFIAKIAPESLKNKDSEGWTCAAIAALRGYDDCLRIIIELAPETLSEPSQNKLTPSSFAALHGNYECLSLIVQNAPDSLIIQDEHGMSPAIYAAYQDKNNNCLKLIIETAPELLTKTDKLGGTPALYAASNGAINNLKYIYTIAPETLSTVNKAGETPLIVAKQNEHTSIVNFIKEMSGEPVSNGNKGCMLILLGITFLSSFLLLMLFQF